MESATTALRADDPYRNQAPSLTAQLRRTIITEAPTKPPKGGAAPRKTVPRDTGRQRHARPSALIFVLCGGALGAAAREAISQAWPTHPLGFPTATLAINLAGAFALGVLLEALARCGVFSGWRRRARLFAGTGFCGAFTTYSTLAVETVQLARHGAWGTGIAYIGVSVIGGTIAVAAGIALAALHARAVHGQLPIDPDVDADMGTLGGQR